MWKIILRTYYVNSMSDIKFKTFKKDSCEKTPQDWNETKC